MAKKIDTTTRKFKEGIAFTEKAIEVAWESTGHLSARLLDASGSAPLADVKVSVDIPDEGRVELTTDQDGKIFHADVPFQDYELELDRPEGKVKVSVPAVASRGEVHERHVPGVVLAFVDLELRSHDHRRLAGAAVTLVADGRTFELRADEDGCVEQAAPLPPGTYKIKVGEQELEVELPATPTPRVVVIPPPTGEEPA